MHLNNTDFNHLKKRNSDARPGLTAGFAVPMYNQTRKMAVIQTIAYTQFTRNMIKIFKAAYNTDVIK